MSMVAGVAIHFFVDGKPFAFRRYNDLPAVGDEMVFHKRDGTFTTYKVVRRVFGAEADDTSSQRVNIELELVP